MGVLAVCPTLGVRWKEWEVMGGRQVLSCRLWVGELLVATAALVGFVVLLIPQRTTNPASQQQLDSRLSTLDARRSTLDARHLAAKLVDGADSKESLAHSCSVTLDAKESLAFVLCNTRLQAIALVARRQGIARPRAVTLKESLALSTLAPVESLCSLVLCDACRH